MKQEVINFINDVKLPFLASVEEQPLMETLTAYNPTKGNQIQGQWTYTTEIKDVAAVFLGNAGTSYAEITMNLKEVDEALKSGKLNEIQKDVFENARTTLLRAPEPQGMTKEAREEFLALDPHSVGSFGTNFDFDTLCRSSVARQYTDEQCMRLKNDKNLLEFDQAVANLTYENGGYMTMEGVRGLAHMLNNRKDFRETYCSSEELEFMPGDNKVQQIWERVGTKFCNDAKTTNQSTLSHQGTVSTRTKTKFTPN